MPKFVHIDSWKQLVDFLLSLHEVDLACRGQEKAYEGVMKAKLDRSLNIKDLKPRLRVERAACQRFREHAPVYLSDVERRYLETRWLQLVVMQHYGAPTRLLDWTKSAWVAAFFAVFGGWESDGYLYVFRRDLFEDRIRNTHAAELNPLVWGPHKSDLRFSDERWDRAVPNEALFDFEIVKGLSEWVATYYSREAHFPRLVAQQGFFTFGSRPDLDHWK